MLDRSITKRIKIKKQTVLSTPKINFLTKGKYPFFVQKFITAIQWRLHRGVETGSILRPGKLCHR